MPTYKYTHADNTHSPVIDQGFIHGMGGASLWCNKCGQVLEYIETEYIIHSDEVIISPRWATLRENSND